MGYVEDKEMNRMSLTIEEEAGVYTRIPTHNGYYAADFCDVPEATPRQLSALTRLRPTYASERQPG